MPTTYDPAVIQEFADALYARARSIVAVCTVVGAVVAWAAFTLANTFNGGGARVGFGELLLIAGVGGVPGYFFGRARAFALRLQAQMALVQVRIEENTRPQGVVSAAPKAARASQTNSTSTDIA